MSIHCQVIAEMWDKEDEDVGLRSRRKWIGKRQKEGLIEVERIVLGSWEKSELLKNTTSE
jgi:hypothetical protein